MVELKRQKRNYQAKLMTDICFWSTKKRSKLQGRCKEVPTVEGVNKSDAKIRPVDQRLD